MIDWWQVQLTLLPLILIICLWPTTQLIIVLPLFLICFLLLLFMLILFPFPILEEFVISPPIMLSKANARRTCLSSPVQQCTLVSQVVKLLFLSSMKDCGLVANFHTLSSIKTNFSIMVFPSKTTFSIMMFPFNQTLRTYHSSDTNIFLNIHTPTQHELDTCLHLHLTSEAEWNPQTMHLTLPQSVEVEANTSDTGFDDGKPGIFQISCVYSFTVMMETLHDVNSN